MVATVLYTEWEILLVDLTWGKGRWKWMISFSLFSEAKLEGIYRELDEPNWKAAKLIWAEPVTWKVLI